MQYLATQFLNKLEFQEQSQAFPTLAKKNYLEELHKVNGIKLSKWPNVGLANMQDLDKGHLLGSGSFGSLHKANWLGESYAMRIPGYQARACSSGMCFPPSHYASCLLCWR